MAIKTHRPQRLPVQLDADAFSKELGEAHYAIGLLEGSQRGLANPDLLISPLTAKEAEISSKIEGTQSTASDVFVYEAGGQPRYSDTIEVANYRKAMIVAMEMVKDGRSITAHFIKTLHHVLLSGARHKGKIGEFRSGPVWIAARPGDPIEKAIYIPPEAISVSEHMENLLEYMGLAQEDYLIQSGVLHYQFEAIHPFEDGNGRIGRLLVPLLLYQRKRISSPIIYLSGFFEAHRDEYVGTLHGVDETGKMEPWLKFFFRAITAQAKETQDLIAAIHALHDKIEKGFGSIKSPYAIPLIDFLFKSPVFTIPMAMRELKATRVTCGRLLDQLLKDGVVVDLKKRDKHAKLYSFAKLLNLLR